MGDIEKKAENGIKSGSSSPYISGTIQAFWKGGARTEARQEVRKSETDFRIVDMGCRGRFAKGLRGEEPRLKGGRGGWTSRRGRKRKTVG